eukprot:scaffold1924_cov218-Amphora_coffeaeformis.AAC.8
MVSTTASPRCVAFVYSMLFLLALVPCRADPLYFPVEWDGDNVDSGPACSGESPLCCLDKEGLRRSSAMLLLSTFSTNNDYQRVSTDLVEERYDNVTTPDAVLRVNGVGFYPTVEDAAEYLSLAHSDLNGGFFSIEFMDFFKAECETENRAVFYMNTNLEFQGEKLNEKLVYQLNYAFNSSLIAHVTAQIPTRLSERITRAPSIREICETAILRCPGDLYPFKNLKECYEVYSLMPETCPHGNPNVNPRDGGGPAQGNTRTCRILHMHSSGLRPSVHCAHLAEISVKCPPELCTRAPGPVEKPYKVFDQDFSKTRHEDWVRGTEMVLVFVFLGAGVSTYVWFTRARVFQFQQASRTDDDVDCAGQLMPILHFKNLRLRWSVLTDSTDDDDLVVQCAKEYIGGCKITGIVGKLLSGFAASHMDLSFDHAADKEIPDIVFCPQDAEMWPKEMLVRDVLFFACTLSGTSPSDFEDSFEGLGLKKIYERPFGVLSGGQKQRVNIATCIVRQTPALVLLDEPLASLDEDTAISALAVLRNLPVKHSFIMTAHQSGTCIQSFFDRILYFDTANKILRGDYSPMMLNSFSVEDTTTTVESIANGGSVRPERVPAFATFKAMLILWHGQFYARPYLAMIMILFSAISGVLTALIGRPSLTESTVQTMLSLRSPIFASFMPFGITFLTSLCVAIVYSSREQPLVKNFGPQKRLMPLQFLFAVLFRSSIYAILQCATWTICLYPLLGLWGDYIDIVFMNTVVFATAWTFATYLVNLVPQVGSLTVVGLDVFAIFFSGVFSLYSATSGFVRFLQAVNPLYYITMANAALLIETFDTGCGDTAHPGFCATSKAILDMTEIQSVSSLGAQAGCLIVIMVSFVVGWHVLLPASYIEEATGVVEETDEGDALRSSLRRSSVSSEMNQSLLWHRSLMSKDEVHLCSEQWDIMPED